MQQLKQWKIRECNLNVKTIPLKTKYLSQNIPSQLFIKFSSACQAVSTRIQIILFIYFFKRIILQTFVLFGYYRYMFDQPLNYKLVQVNRNRYKTVESFNREFIYKFHRHNYKCCIKYIVSVKEYDQKYLTLDFYPKINLTPKQMSVDSLQDLRYRLLTRQNSFGFIGATILSIINDIQEKTTIHTWGFLAASLPWEITNYNNKRFNVYVSILRRTIIHHHFIFGNRNNSAIFVIPIKSLNNKELIAKRYEQIFSETN